MCDMHIDLAAVGKRWHIDVNDYFSTAIEQLRQRARRLNHSAIRQRLLASPPLDGCLIRHLGDGFFDARLADQPTQRYSKIV